MRYTRLGGTGLEVSRICFGTMSFGKKTEERPWVLPLEEARPMFRKAWEGGVNFIDTANVYAAGTSEEITGALVRELAPREEIILATKVFNRTRPGPNGMGLSRQAILHEIDASLRRLGTDYVDLYQIHRHDPTTPYEETMEALHDVVKAGKARYIGASSMWAWQFAKYQHAAERNGWTRFVSMQDELSLIYREEEREMIPLCRADGIGVIPWSPLGGGKLTRPWGTRTDRARTDKFNRSMYDEVFAGDQPIVAAVAAIADKRGVTMTEVSLAWLLQKPGVTAPIIGASRLEQLEPALKSLDLRLSPEDVSALEAPYLPCPVRGY
jgi:aryl-alcohol dehydrogenase-like predicted oxidoreductase